MSKELIKKLRIFGGELDNGSAYHEAADTIEQQQSWIASLEQHAKDADRMYKELETSWHKLLISYQRLRDELNTERCLSLRNQVDAQQKRIELYEQALKASWPEGAMGDAFDYWNAARIEDK